MFNITGLPAPEIASLPTRLGSMKNLTYFALAPQSFIGFDWLAVWTQRYTAAVGRLCNIMMQAPSRVYLRKTEVKPDQEIGKQDNSHLSSKWPGRA